MWHVHVHCEGHYGIALYYTFLSSADSMEVDGALASFDLTALQRKFSREYTNLYLKIAHSARLQSNYPVATKYLKLTESALNEVALKSPQIDLNNLR